MIPQSRCWRCRKLVDAKASILCPECHATEKAKIHAHDTPTADELGLLGQQGDYGYLMIQGIRNMSAGRRVIRKSEPLVG